MSDGPYPPHSNGASASHLAPNSHAPLSAPYRDVPSSGTSFDSPRGSAAYGNDVEPSKYSPGSPAPATFVAPLLNPDSGTPYRDDTASRGGAAAMYNEKGYSAPQKSRKKLWIVCAAVALIVIVVAVVVPVYFVVIKKKGDSGNDSGNGTTGVGSTNPGSPSGAITGGDGSVITMDDGSTFIYNNTFGGFWVQNPADPFNSSARPNSYTKPLSEKWDFVKDPIYGVNLGGWFVLEPFINPSYYQNYPGAVDEYTLSNLMANDTENGGLDQLEKHYATFITEKDIAQIAGAGLNWVRVPIPFWAVDTMPGEPFLAKKSWPYIVKLLDWCRKYGIRVNLDLHTIPGSQNGYNHSGRLGSINWLFGAMGLANAQRSLDYIRTIAEFVSQPEYRDVVCIFGFVNEALLGNIGLDVLGSFYYEAHKMIREITGINDGAWISIHDGFKPVDTWTDFLHGSDRIIMDTHPYLAFGGPDVMKAPFINGTGHGAGAGYPLRACQSWASGILKSQQTFGVTIAGEFSNGWNDCGLFLHGVDDSQSFPGDCSQWTRYQDWTDEMKDGVKNFAMASMDTLQNWFFWTWKIGPAQNGTIVTPLWSYQLGLENGWMPLDPRTANGTCASYGYDFERFNNTYQPYQIGGGDGTIALDQSSSYGQFPPATISAFPTSVPYSAAAVFTPTGTQVTLAMPTITDASGHTASFSANGWADKSDTVGRYVTVADCSYPDPYNTGPTVTAVCTGSATATLGSVSGAVGTPPPTAAPARRRI